MYSTGLLILNAAFLGFIGLQKILAWWTSPKNTGIYEIEVVGIGTLNLIIISTSTFPNTISVGNHLLLRQWNSPCIFATSCLLHYLTHPCTQH